MTTQGAPRRLNTPFGRVASAWGVEKDLWLNDIDERKLRYCVTPMRGESWADELIEHARSGSFASTSI